MRKHFKIISLAAAAFMLAGLLAACGGANTQESNVSTTAAAQKTAAETKDEKKTDTLRILAGNSQSVDMSNDPAKLLADKLTGYKTQWDYLPGDPNQVKEKLSMLLASGEPYDLIKIDTPDMTKEFIPKNYFIPLDDLLGKYGKNIIANTSPKWFAPMKVNGKIYAIPVKRTSPADIVGTIYRKDIFDKYQISNDSMTPDEFKAALTKIKDEAKIIPYTSPASSPIIETIASAFGICQNAWYDVDGTLVNRVKMKGYVDYLKYVSELVKEGLLDKEIAANKDEVVQKKMASGEAAAAYWAWWWWSGNDAIRQNSGAELAFMKPMKSADGNSIAWLWATTAEWTTVIPKSSQYPEDAMKYLDALCDNKNFEQVFLGTEGVHYQKQGDTFVPTEQFTKEKKNSFMVLMVTNDNFREKYQTIAQAGEDPKKDVLFTYTGLKNAAEGIAVEDPTVELSVPEANGKYYTALDKMERDFVLAVISGVKSVDEYPQFIEQWNKNGGTELEKQWNEMYANSRK